MSSLALADYGWDTFFQNQLDHATPATIVPVRVMNVQKSGLQIAGSALDQHVAAGLTDEESPVTVGDWLLFDTEAERIRRLLDRKSLFKRRAPGTDRREQLIAAHIDTIFVVSSCNQDFTEARIERYLSIAREAGVIAVVVLTKADLADEPQQYVSAAAKLSPEIVVEAVNALDKDSLRGLDGWLGAGQTVALLGSSGVGKSTITNTLLGGEHILTRDVRTDDDKGRHTTTSRSMYRLPGGAWLIDTPGMRELQLTDVQGGIEDVFAEISALAESCRFSDCAHEGEPGCAVRAAIAAGSIDAARLDRWRKLRREEALNTETIAERRARGRALGKFYKSVIEGKKSTRNQ